MGLDQYVVQRKAQNHHILSESATFTTCGKNLYMSVSIYTVQFHSSKEYIVNIFSRGAPLNTQKGRFASHGENYSACENSKVFCALWELSMV